MSIVNKDTQTLPDFPPGGITTYTPPLTMPFQMKLTNLINDFNQVYVSNEIQPHTKKKILTSQTEYLEEFLYALINDLDRPTLEMK